MPEAPTLLIPRPIASSVEELLQGATRRQSFDPVERRSTASFERVYIDDEPHIVKYLHADEDFAMRAMGDTGSRTLKALAAGLFDAAADVIDHAVVGAAPGFGRNGWGCAVLMRDVSNDLVPLGDAPFPEGQHRGFIDHLARMCAATWGWRDDIGLAPYPARYTFTGIDALASEREREDPERV
ncbi:MAG TPA: hypothetical protein VMY34_11100, partial [Acidimicrobiales bacterium]|nr:hypothetical protein [Acidimicrobiales bacterium]